MVLDRRVAQEAAQHAQMRVTLLHAMDGRAACLSHDSMAGVSGVDGTDA